MSEILEVALRHPSVVDGGAVGELARALEPHVRFEAFGIACTLADGSVELLAAPEGARTLVELACSAANSGPPADVAVDGRGLRSVSFESGRCESGRYVAVFVSCAAGEDSREPAALEPDAGDRVPLLIFAGLIGWAAFAGFAWIAFRFLD